ncbi:MAG: hypothetical protein OXG62_06375 [Nitrospinae bacterium]|nr:hypothetical protein [Nitrospinota bacterium]
MITRIYMKLLTLIVLFILSLTAGCTGGGSPPPPVPTPTLTPVPQPFRAQTTFVDNVLSVDVRYHDGRIRTLDTVRHLDGSWGRFLPRPLQPGHSSREWILAENHYDGRILLYVVVDWDDADPSDYLAAGWWLVYPPGEPVWEVESATRGVFIDGPELDPARPPDLPLTSTATYVGGAGGVYTYNYGRDWGEELAGSTDHTEFAGIIALTADFESKRITGCLGCLEPIEPDPGRHLYPIFSWRTPDPAASPAGYEMRFSASFDAKGAFEDTAITVTHPEREITQAAGTWRGQFSNVPDADGNPRRVVGSTDVHFAEEDGSTGRFTGIFDALTPATLKPADDSNGGNAN